MFLRHKMKRSTNYSEQQTQILWTTSDITYVKPESVQSIAQQNSG